MKGTLDEAGERLIARIKLRGYLSMAARCARIPNMHGTLRGYVAIARCRLLSLRAAISKYERALDFGQSLLRIAKILQSDPGLFHER